MEHEKTLTPVEAWDNFWLWLRGQPKWQDLTREEKNELYKASRARKIGKPYNLGPARIRHLLDKHAPGRYEFREVVIVHEDPK
jgi:hypothetical protein